MKAAPVVKTIQLGEIRLEYYLYGNGPDKVICLHGHGRSAEDFAFLSAPQRTVISIHLFFHGESFFPAERIESNPLTFQETNDIFQKLLKEELIDRFHLFAFSQGGRFALCLLPVFAGKVQSLTLIAPDGMDNSSFYNWGSRQWWARQLMQRWEKDPRRLYRISKLGKTLGFVRPKVAAFVGEFTSSKKDFKRASQTWRCFRELKPNPEIIGRTLKEKKIPFLIIMGKHDQVIRPKQAKSFITKCGLKDSIAIIDSGHNFFKERTINKFLHLLPFVQ
jgi:pimeloyl-ACP methyl ester carboxylesterase